MNTTATTKKSTTTTSTKKAVPKLPEVLLKKRKLYADLKARRLRTQVQAAKVKQKNLSSLLQKTSSSFFLNSIRNTNV